MSFVAELSTDSICVGADTSLCLSNKLSDMEDAIKAGQSGSTVSPLLTASMHLGKLDNNNGSELASSDRICSDPIAVENGKTYWQVNDRGVNMYVLLYNADEMFVQFVGNIASGQAIIISHADAAFLRLGSLVGDYDMTNVFHIYDQDPASGGTDPVGDGYSKEEADAKFAALAHSHSDYAAASHSHSYATLTHVPTTFSPSAHKSSHATGGSDALTAADLAAIPVTQSINGKALSEDVSISAADLDAVSVSRAVNGQSLSADIALAAADLNAVPLSRTINGKDLSQDLSVNAAELGAVPTSRTINGKALSGDLSLTTEDTSAVPTARTVNGKALTADLSLSATELGIVPTSRTINGQALSGNVNVTANSLGALSTGGGTITGNLTLKGAGNYGNKINLGNGDFVHLYEASDNTLEIKGSRIQFLGSGDGSVTINGSPIATKAYVDSFI